MNDQLVFVLQHLAIVAGFLLAMMFFARVFARYSHPGTSIAWLLAMVFIPYVGVPLYLIFGGRKLRGLASRKPAQYRPAENDRPAPDNDTARLLSAYGVPPARSGTEVEFCTDGEQAFTRLLELIEGAQTSIHIVTFILANDHVGRLIVERLAAKARQGIEVRLLIDALGGLRARFSLVREITRAGGEVGIFMPMLPIRRRWSANLRNHRKIAVFDERTVLTGGMNLAREFMGPEPDGSRWVDTCVILTGAIVSDLSTLFTHDWEFATGRVLTPRRPAVTDALSGAVTQLVASGPDVAGDPLRDAIVSAIHKAKQRIWIVTPYFVPDDGLLRALEIQARIGVDVRLIMPRRSNHWTADMARNRSLRALTGSGTRIFLHPDRMIHAKHVLIDDVLSVFGSANVDVRSLYVNYEAAVVSYTAAANGLLGVWMNRLMGECKEGGVPERTFVRGWSEDLCWLMSPLL